MNNQQLKESSVLSDAKATDSQPCEGSNPKTIPAGVLVDADSLISVKRGELQELIIRKIDAPAEEKPALESRRRSLAREIMSMEKREKRRKDEAKRVRIGIDAPIPPPDPKERHERPTLPIKSKRCGPKEDRVEIMKRKRGEEDNWDTDQLPGAKKPLKRHRSSTQDDLISYVIPSAAASSAASHRHLPRQVPPWWRD